MHHCFSVLSYGNRLLLSLYRCHLAVGNLLVHKLKLWHIQTVESKSYHLLLVYAENIVGVR